jgi:hypothetical protein
MPPEVPVGEHEPLPPPELVVSRSAGPGGSRSRSRGRFAEMPSGPTPTSGTTTPGSTSATDASLRRGGRGWPVATSPLEPEAKPGKITSCKASSGSSAHAGRRQRRRQLKPPSRHEPTVARADGQPANSQSAAVEILLVTPHIATSDQSQPEPQARRYLPQSLPGTHAVVSKPASTAARRRCQRGAPHRTNDVDADKRRRTLPAPETTPLTARIREGRHERLSWRVFESSPRRSTVSTRPN